MANLSVGTSTSPLPAVQAPAPPPEAASQPSPEPIAAAAAKQPWSPSVVTQKVTVKAAVAPVKGTRSAEATSALTALIASSKIDASGGLTITNEKLTQAQFKTAIGEVGLLKLIFNADDMKLLGVHCLGEGATELIHIGLMALMAGATADLFIQTCFNYPTLSEAYKYAAYDALGRKAKSPFGSPE